MQIFFKMKYDLRSHRIPFMTWRGCVAFLLSDFRIVYHSWLTFLWTTFVLVCIMFPIYFLADKLIFLFAKADQVSKSVSILEFLQEIHIQLNILGVTLEINFNVFFSFILLIWFSFQNAPHILMIKISKFPRLFFMFILYIHCKNF